MKVIFHADFYPSYTHDPAAASGRLNSSIKALESVATFIDAVPAPLSALEAVHSTAHIERVRRQGLFEIAALAAGGAIQAAMTGLTEPCFGLIRPPGHHASRDSAWGFCYFNNMAVAIEHLKQQKRIQTACILDIDLHYGDGTVNILGNEPWVTVVNFPEDDRGRYVQKVAAVLADCPSDMIAVSAGFDNHELDWGGLLHTEDYREIGRLVHLAAQRNQGGCFALLEGGYNHRVLGDNVLALMQGMTG